MPVEHQPTPGCTPEHASVQLEATARERLEQLKQTPEAAPEAAKQRAEAAREVINRPDAGLQPPAAEAAPPAPRPTLAAHLDHALNYNQTLASLQRHLSPVARAFSHVIHAPAIEKSSEALETTVARPSILNGAIWGAFLVGLIFYITARTYGFPLSGSEMLLALAGGAVTGLALEGIGRLFRRR